MWNPRWICNSCSRLRSRCTACAIGAKGLRSSWASIARNSSLWRCLGKFVGSLSQGRNVFDGEQDQLRVFGIWREWLSIEQHGLPTETRKGMFNLKVENGLATGKDSLQQCPQAGNVPLAVTQVVQMTVLCFLLRDLK